MVTAFQTAEANADCATKASMLSEAVRRLQDYVTSTDNNQQVRDDLAIRNLQNQISDEDCIGISKANQRLVDIITAVVVSIGDFSSEGEGTDIDFQPIENQVGHAIDQGDTSDCRCFARKMAVERILEEASSLRFTWSERPSPLVATAIRYYWMFLDQQLDDATGGISLGSIAATDVAFHAVSAVVDQQLRRFCNLRLYRTVQIFPSCRYSIYNASSPEP
ncbi:MAG: hypothetical protein ACYC8W_04705 [Candidatus Tyrphobacter sp.]